MKFIPANNYIHVEEIRQDQELGGFQWTKVGNDLTAVEILSGANSGKTAVVISTMIQNFEYKKQVFRVIPDTAIIGFIEE